MSASPLHVQQGTLPHFGVYLLAKVYLSSGTDHLPKAMHMLICKRGFEFSTDFGVKVHTVVSLDLIHKHGLALLHDTETLAHA